MKKTTLALFVCGQVMSMAGFACTAHAANLSASQSNNTAEFSNTLAETLTTVASDPHGAISTIASGYASTGLSHYLNQYGHASASVNFTSKGRLASADINFLKPIINTKKNTFYYQASYHQPYHRKIFSVGLGDRQFFDHQKALYGVNTFVDADTRGNVRGSLGGELMFNYARFSANYYLPISRWRDAEGMSYYNARPARGFDVHFKGYLPEYPSLTSTLSYSQYFGHVGVFNADTLTNNPYVFSYGVEYRPIQLISLSAERQKATGDQSQTIFGLHFHYQFDVPLKQQLRTMPTHYGTLNEERYAFVERNYTMPLAYQEIDHLAVTLQGGIVNDGTVVFPNFFANHKITHIQWGGSLVKYLNSDSIKNPVIENYPDDLSGGTLTITITDSTGRTATTTAIFTHPIKTIVVPPKTNILKITSVSSNTDAYALVSGVADPNTMVTIVFPDGSTKKVKSNDKGDFSTTSKYAWIQKGEITAQAGQLKTSHNFTPDVVGKLQQNVGYSTYGCFTFSHFNAPNGATVHMLFSNGFETSAQVVSNDQLDLFPTAAYLPSGELKAYITMPDGHQSAPISTNFQQKYAPSVSITSIKATDGGKTVNFGYWGAPSAQPYTVKLLINNKVIGQASVPASHVTLSATQKAGRSWGSNQTWQNSHVRVQLKQPLQSGDKIIVETSPVTNPKQVAYGLVNYSPAYGGIGSNGRFYGATPFVAGFLSTKFSNLTSK